MENKISYSVVIATFNSAQTLAELTQRIQKVFTETILQNYEIIFVNDGSTNPETKSTLIEIQKNFPGIQVIELSRNFGQHAATLCGINYAKGEYIITMDDDLQHMPEDIPHFISMQQHDIVIGHFKDNKHPLGKRLGSRIKSYFDRILLGKPKNLQLSSFRLINKVIAKNFLKIETPYPYLPAFMFYVTNDIVNVDVRHEERRSGKSGYSSVKLIKMISNLLLNNSSFLLKLIAGLGITVSILSFCVMGFFLFKKIFWGIPIIGWTSIILTLLGIGGIMLFAIGILGEYLIRMIAGIEKRPTYIVRNHSQSD